MPIPNAPRKHVITMEVLIILLIFARRIKISILYPLSLELGMIMLGLDHRLYVPIVGVFGTLFTLARTIIVFIIIIII